MKEYLSIYTGYQDMIKMTFSTSFFFLKTDAAREENSRESLIYKKSGHYLTAF